MTDDAHPDRPAPTREPVRVARFDLTDEPGSAPVAGAPPAGPADAPPADGPADVARACGPADVPAAGESANDTSTASTSTAGTSTVDTSADTLTDAGRGSRVARFDGLTSAAGRRARVAEFDGLTAGQDRPLAPVIPLDPLGDRRGSAARPTPADVARPEAPASDDDRPPVRGRGQAAGSRRPRSTRGPIDPPLSGIAGPSGEGLPGDAAAQNSARDGAHDETAGDGIPPDRPLPTGRRMRARVGRLGPDAPDPELPLPEADPVAIAREICLRLLTDRARTRQELAQALTRKGVPEQAAAAVLDRFAEVGLIDDAAFAGQWVRSRHTYRGLGRRAIAVELRRKGVADGVAKEALAEVDAESEDRRARELVDRKLRSMSVSTADQRATAARRLVGMLARKGYGAGTAYRVVREALAEHGAEADELGGTGEHDE